MDPHDDLTERLTAPLTTACAGLGPVGVAVSGGGDSLALLHLMARAGLPGLQVATVDHRLRDGSAREAAMVADVAAGLGLPHRTLGWDDWDRRGNLQDAARRARQSLLGDWARAEGLQAIALGHTLDDQAETVLMRLARGSGVDGLAGMAARRVDGDGLLWLRPLLHERRETLRDWLRGAGLAWVEDPSNDDARFDRVRARRLVSACADLGLTAEGLADTADRMTAAAAVLNAQAFDACQRLVRVEAGVIHIGAGLWDLADDTRWRLLAAAHCQVSGNPYRPRLVALRQGEGAARTGRAHTLHGCLMRPDRGGVWIQPELKALREHMTAVPGIWAGWKIIGPQVSSTQCGPLGAAGLRALDDWRILGLPYEIAQVLPGVWQGETLVGAPLYGLGAWSAEPLWGQDEFTRVFISH